MPGCAVCPWPRAVSGASFPSCFFVARPCFAAGRILAIHFDREVWVPISFARILMNRYLLSLAFLTCSLQNAFSQDAIPKDSVLDAQLTAILQTPATLMTGTIESQL